MLVDSWSRGLDFLAYGIAEFSFVLLLGNVFGVYWIRDTLDTNGNPIKSTTDEGYPFNYHDWQVTVQAFLCISVILMFASFMLERLIGVEKGGYTLKSTIAGFWFCSMICTVVGMSFYTGYVKGVSYGMSYRFGWSSACLNLVASCLYAFV